MIQFDAAPLIPSDYERLRSLSSQELRLAVAAGYVAKEANSGERIPRCGLDNYQEPAPDDDIRDWRTRVYVIWFCYIFENLATLAKPVEAIEEIILEFRAPSIIDTPERRLATLYAGMGASKPLSESDSACQLKSLQPHYDKAIASLQAALLDGSQSCGSGAMDRMASTMREPDITKVWIAAGKALAAKSTASVPCPACGKADLIVEDVTIRNSNKFERIMRCPVCGERNILLMTAP